MKGEEQRRWRDEERRGLLPLTTSSSGLCPASSSFSLPHQLIATDLDANNFSLFLSRSILLSVVIGSWKDTPVSSLALITCCVLQMC